MKGSGSTSSQVITPRRIMPLITNDDFCNHLKLKESKTVVQGTLEYRENVLHMQFPVRSVISHM